MLATKQELESMQGGISTPLGAENMLSGLLDKLHRRFEKLVNTDYDVAAGDDEKKEMHVAPRVNKMLEVYKQQVIAHLQCKAH